MAVEAPTRATAPSPDTPADSDREHRQIGVRLLLDVSASDPDAASRVVDRVLAWAAGDGAIEIARDGDASARATIVASGSSPVVLQMTTRLEPGDSRAPEPMAIVDISSDEDGIDPLERYQSSSGPPPRPAARLDPGAGVFFTRETPRPLTDGFRVRSFPRSGAEPSRWTSRLPAWPVTWTIARVAARSRRFLGLAVLATGIARAGALRQARAALIVSFGAVQRVRAGVTWVIHLPAKAARGMAAALVRPILALTEARRGSPRGAVVLSASGVRTAAHLQHAGAVAGLALLAALAVSALSVDGVRRGLEGGVPGSHLTGTGSGPEVRSGGAMPAPSGVTGSGAAVVSLAATAPRESDAADAGGPLALAADYSGVVRLPRLVTADARTFAVAPGSAEPGRTAVATRQPRARDAASRRSRRVSSRTAATGPADARVRPARKAASGAASPTSSSPAAFTGTLEVVTSPAGADVYVNGVHHGRSPIRLDGIRAGAHAVRVDKDGFERWTRAVTVRTSGRILLTPRLQPSTPTMAAGSE